MSIRLILATTAVFGSAFCFSWALMYSDVLACSASGGGQNCSSDQADCCAGCTNGVECRNCSSANKCCVRARCVDGEPDIDCGACGG